MKNESPFSIHNPKEIIRHVSLLIENKCLISARFGNDNESYITTLLNVDAANNSIILDYGPKENLNKHLLDAPKINFDTDYKGIKVSFTGIELKKIIYKGEPAFRMPIPKSLYWMQRRDFYRVKSPMSKPSYCQIILPERQPVNLTLFDISLTGFSMLNISKELSELLIVGKSFEQCKLILLDTDNTVISFEICNKYIINPGKLQKIQKIGCKFIKISNQVENVIQRYMQQIQREILQKEK